MKFHSKDTSLRYMTHVTTSFPKSEFHVFLLIVSWSWVWNFIQKIPPWEIWHVTLQFRIKISQFCAYFWAQKLVWNFIQKIPLWYLLWEIWHIILQIQMKIFQFCAYFWLKLVWNFIQKIPPCRNNDT